MSGRALGAFAAGWWRDQWYFHGEKAAFWKAPHQWEAWDWCGKKGGGNGDRRPWMLWGTWEQTGTDGSLSIGIIGSPWRGAGEKGTEDGGGEQGCPCCLSLLSCPLMPLKDRPGRRQAKNKTTHPRLLSYDQNKQFTSLWKCLLKVGKRLWSVMLSILGVLQNFSKASDRVIPGD